MKYLKVIPFLIPACISWSVAVTQAIAQTTLQEENRRLIERHEERFDVVRKDIIEMKREVEALRSEVFWLLVANGGLGALIGVDKGRYYIKKRNGQ